MGFLTPASRRAWLGASQAGRACDFDLKPHKHAALCLPANLQAQNIAGAQDLSVKQRDEQMCAEFVRSLPPPTHRPSAPPHSPP